MKLRKIIRLQFVIVAAIVGLGITAITNATRNASGTYSLPAGNPVVSGTTISSTTHNNTMSDVSTEITDSLSRTGKGGMLAPLLGVVGTVAAPAFSYTADPDTGWYHSTTNGSALSCGGTQVIAATSSQVTFPVGLTVTQSAANATAIYATGNGSGTGGYFVGGSAAGWGINTFGGAGGGVGIIATGVGGGSGGNFFGDTTGLGVDVTGGASAAGGRFRNGTAATGGTRKDAIIAYNGDLDMSGVAYPTSTTGLTNRLTPANIPKAWVNVTTGTPTVNAGFNIASATEPGGNLLRVTFATAMANANYSAVCNMQNSGAGTPAVVAVTTFNTAYFEINAWSVSAGALLNLANSVGTVTCEVFGTQ